MVIILMFGALMYFDVLNPENYINEECLFGTNILCEDWSINKITANTFDINLKLRNNLEKAIEPDNILIYDNDGNNINNCQFKMYCPFDGTSANWTAGSSGSFSRVGIDPKWGVGKSCRLQATDCEKTLISDTKETFRITLGFKRIGGSTNHPVNAKLFAKVVS